VNGGLWSALGGMLVSVPVFFVLGTPFHFLTRGFSEAWRGLYRFVFGMAAVVILLNAAGIHRLMTPAVAAGGALAIMAAGFLQIGALVSWLRALDEELFSQSGVWAKTAWIFSGVVLFSTLGLCFLPETGNDALCYQLYLAKVFVREGRIFPLPFDHNSTMPLFMNTLYAGALLFRTITLAKFYHWLTGTLLFLALALKIRKDTGRAALSAWIALIFYVTPTVFNEVSTTYVDVAAALFVFLGVEALLRSFETKKRTHAAVSGVLLGCAVGTKLLLLITALPVLAVILAAGRTQRKGGLIFRVLLWCLFGFLAAAGFWFLRTALVTGNPVFPYLGKFFGTEDFGLESHFQKMGPPKSLLRFLLLPLMMTFSRMDFDGGYWIGPAYLAVLPFALWAFFRKPAVRPLGIFCLFFTIAWYGVFHNARFLLPVYPVYLTAAAIGLHAFFQKHPGSLRPAAASGFFLFLFLGALGLYHSRMALPVITGQWDRETYLRNLERSWPAADWINHNLAPDAYLLNAEEIRGFYIDRRQLRESWLYLGTRYDRNAPSPEVLAGFLRAEGFTHVLRTSSIGESTASENSRGALLDSMLERPDLARELIQIDSVNIREARYRYKVYELKAAA